VTAATVTPIPVTFTEPVEGEVLPPAGITETCPEPGCGEEFIGPPGGKGSAPMLLGRHLWSKHRIKGDGTRAPTKGRGGKTIDAGALLDDAHPVAATVAAVGAQVTGTGAPRAEQLAKALGVGLSAITGGAARWAVRTDPVFQAAVAQAPEQEGAERTRDLVAALSLSHDAGAKVLAPVARILAPTGLNKKYGRMVVENTDIGPAVTELADVVGVWFTYLAGRRADRAEARAQREAAAGFPGVPVAGPAPAPPIVPPPAAPAAGPIGGGFIATAAH
jgi:hypothetical protein